MLARALWEAAPGCGGARTLALQVASEAITGYRAAGEDDYR